MKATILSAGIVLSEILNNNEAVTSRVTQIFPVAVDEAVLPYVRYIRVGMTVNPAKTGSAARSAQVEIDCYAASYGESVMLAEAVTEALDGVQYRSETTGQVMRSCLLTDAKETATDDAFVQTLIFNIKI